MAVPGIQKTLQYTHTHPKPIDQVFPLLCPVREADWLDGWAYRMIYSQSGLIEQDCVFATPHHDEVETFWYVTQYDKEQHLIEFVRMTPFENIVKIQIQLKSIDEEQTESHISYQYTGLNEAQNAYIESTLEEDFQNSMSWWEQSLNHFLKTGEKLPLPKSEQQSEAADKPDSDSSEEQQEEKALEE